MAEVFLAKRAGPAGFEKQLVIKRILPHLSQSDRFTALFLEEARWAALIDHPNLVHVSDFGQIEAQYYLAMEHVDGLTVSELLDRLGTLSPGVACRVVVDLLEALSAIHTAKDEQGRALSLVHRDVSPRNVMLSRAGAVKLLDFGIAVSRAKTFKAPTAGTEAYMSPEQQVGAEVDARSDLFSVAILLHRMLVGSLPFEGPPSSPPSRDASIPEALWPTLERALQISPEARFSDARSMQAQLELFLAGRGLEGTRAHLADLMTQVMPKRSRPARMLSRITRMTRLSALSGSEANATKGGVRRRGALAVVLLLAAFAVFGVGRALLREDPPSSEATALGAAEVPMITDAGAVAVVDAGARAGLVAKLDAGVAPKTAKPARERRRRSTRSSRTVRASKGKLTIDTRPWTEVYWGGKKLGLTPLEGVELPAGRQTLRLRNERLGVNKKISVRIRAGRTTRVQKVL